MMMTFSDMKQLQIGGWGEFYFDWVIVNGGSQKGQWGWDRGNDEARMTNDEGGFEGFAFFSIFEGDQNGHSRKGSFSRGFRGSGVFFHNIHRGVFRGFLVGSNSELIFLRELRGFSSGVFAKWLVPLRQAGNRNDCREVGSICRVKPTRQGPARQAGPTRKGVFASVRDKFQNATFQRGGGSQIQELGQEKVK
jgi:hypothetical protein